jgi:hypothetical protein
MRLDPTKGRPPLSLSWRPQAAEGELFGRYVLVKALEHRGAEAHFLVTTGHRPPSLFLRRLTLPANPRSHPTQAPNPRSHPTQAPNPRSHPTQAPNPRSHPTQAPNPRSHPTQAPNPRSHPTQAPKTELHPKQRALIVARAELDHAGLPNVHELGRVEETIFDVSSYVFGVDLQLLLDNKPTPSLPWVVATEIFRDLMQLLIAMRQNNCLPYRLLQPHNLRFCLERDQPAVNICCNRPFPTDISQPPSERDPFYGAQLRAITAMLLSISSPPDETQRALLLDPSRESADVLADHLQANDLPLDPLSVCKLQLHGSEINRRWLQKSVAAGQHRLLRATDEDTQQLAAFWRAIYDLGHEDRKMLASPRDS